MPNDIHLADNGDDKNDGTENSPIKSWDRRMTLKTGNDRLIILGDSEKTIQRLYKEIHDRNTR